MVDLTVFLGNPGAQYRGNRHNAGWLLASRLPFYGSLDWRSKFRGAYAALDRSLLDPAAPHAEAGRVHFLKPETFMNLSGEAAAQAAAFFKIPPERVLAVHDELELPLGTLSLKFDGGLGGHNGLRSLKACLGVSAFWRLRIGIGRPDNPDIAAWVLSDFYPEEKPLLEQSLTAAAALLTRALTADPASLLPEWSKKRLPREAEG